MPSGLYLEFLRPSVGHNAPSGCLCSGASGPSGKYTKYILQDACRGKPLAKFGGTAHNDLDVFIDLSETLFDAEAFSLQYSFHYDYRTVPSVEHVPKTTLS